MAKKLTQAQAMRKIYSILRGLEGFQYQKAPISKVSQKHYQSQKKNMGGTIKRKARAKKK